VTRGRPVPILSIFVGRAYTSMLALLAFGGCASIGFQEWKLSEADAPPLTCQFPSEAHIYIFLEIKRARLVLLNCRSR